MVEGKECLCNKDWKLFRGNYGGGICPSSSSSVYAGRRTLRVGHGSLFQNPTQPNPKFLDQTQPNPQKYPPDPTQPIIDTWYGILGYTENFIQQLLHTTDKFTVNNSYYSAAVLISWQ